MTKKDIIPTEVLSDKLTTIINGRNVKEAVFTTFNFDPGFFELHVLSLLFDRSFSQVDKVRCIQLEDAISSINNIAVYYDKNAISQDAAPASLDYRRIDISRNTGCFHPKIILLLVDNHNEEDEDGNVDDFQSLIFVVQSANLTRAGWWENLECCHIEEINEKEGWENVRHHYSFRKDLLSLIHKVKNSTDADEDHSAIDNIKDFLVRRTPTKHVHKSVGAGKYYSRLYCGQSSFSEWLVDLKLYKREWNLEVISPYFDSAGVGPLEDLLYELEPNETRIYLPRNSDGSALVTEEVYDSINEIASTYWSEMPGELLKRGGGHVSERFTPRYVHAKVYRLWHRQSKQNIIIVGSVNLTSSAHSHSGAGNFEAAFLVDISDENYKNQWWLSRIDYDVERFSEAITSEEDGLEIARIDLSLRYDWSTKTLEYRLSRDDKSTFIICETNGHPIIQVDRPKVGVWAKFSESESETARQYLTSSSFFLIKHEKGEWRLLVREENMAYKPSLLTQLSPEEILEYWALLSPDQRTAFLEKHLGRHEQLEGLPVIVSKSVKSKNTLFDRFAGIYHSFGCLKKYIETAIEEGRPREAEAFLAGSKYNSLPSLLEKIYVKTDGDPIIRYITFLSAKQLDVHVKKRYKDFLKGKKQRMYRLKELLNKIPEIRRSIPTTHKKKDKEFLEWFEKAFLKDYGK